MAERDLMARVAAGDENAFAELYDTYANRLYRYALVRTGRPAAAEDAVQETLLAAWRNAASFRGESSLATWLFGICHRCLGHLQRKEKTNDTTLEAAPEGAADPWPGEDRRLALLSALNQLSEEQRELIFLVYYQELSLAEAARILEIPGGTVKSRLHVARHRLAALLQDGGVACARG